MFNQMLVPTDGSDAAATAVGHATDLAGAFGADVHALYVVETGEDPSGLEDEEYATLHEASEQRGREATIRIAEDVEEAGLEAARAVREGVPDATILAYVDEHDIDIVVMGTHGRTGADRVRMGSTTERVLMRADIPVLSVPQIADPLGTIRTNGSSCRPTAVMLQNAPQGLHSMSPRGTALTSASSTSSILQRTIWGMLLAVSSACSKRAETLPSRRSQRWLARGDSMSRRRFAVACPPRSCSRTPRWSTRTSWRWARAVGQSAPVVCSAVRRPASSGGRPFLS
ncbi:Nucleotide-binding protein, UspA family [Natranaeroarchaeum sulfidigenes]|uniref:Nucleotide-binding protein, UspA family n=1 Tax=Natranaeroarchaeum sulfidigenes TaxID=2784880 RepID=A0A897MKE3_9EURY|nr:Nucleotide-binding protein, UspA family [Natranaeroarchaeum sulfidigenes]